MRPTITRAVDRAAENDVRSPPDDEPLIQCDVLGTMHRQLRAATRIDHANLDRMMLRINLALPQDYGLFLQIHQSVLQTLQALWREADQEDFSRMQHAVECDIQFLGMAIRPACSDACEPWTSSQQWGIAYVVRGSRLGARYLRRSIPDGLPTAYLDFIPALTWPRFLDQLESIGNGSSDASSADSIRGAHAAFAVFASVFTHALTGEP